MLAIGKNHENKMLWNCFGHRGVVASDLLRVGASR